MSALPPLRKLAQLEGGHQREDARKMSEMPKNTAT
jgi:hypothetical protein